MGRVAWAGAAILLSASALAGCGDGSNDQAVTPSATQAGSPTPAPRLAAVVAASLHEPIALVTRPGDAGHVYVAERAGRVLRLAESAGGDSLTTVGAPVLDITDQTTVESERGLLDIAFSPDGGTLFASFTDTHGDTRVMAYAMDGARADASTRRDVYHQAQPFPNHNGGHLAFGPDGKLWLGLGDGGAANDPDNHAQDPASDLGKILRLDPDSGARQVVVSGVRNPWRWAFDTDGSLWIADVGQDHWEEIDHLPAGEIDGANLGWSGHEGTHANDAVDPAGRTPKTWVRPIFEYSHEGGNCSITGGFVYRGSALEDLDGAFLFADYCAGALRAITLDADGGLGTEYDLGLHLDNPISFGQDQAGEPFVLLDGGNVVHLVPAA